MIGIVIGTRASDGNSDRASVSYKGSVSDRAID